MNSNLTNQELLDTILYSNKTDKRNEAWEQLRKNLNIVVPVDEEALIKQIAHNVLERPGALNMDSWHCGTSHCLAGWACVLNPIASEIESKTDTETAGCAVLPSYANLFFSDNETVLKILKDKVGK